MMDECPGPGVGWKKIILAFLSFSRKCDKFWELDFKIAKLVPKQQNV